MPRYIDADKLHVYSYEFPTLSKGRKAKIPMVFYREIQNAPTVHSDDVRRVVHCGECKFWRRPPSCEGLARCETGETGIRYRSKNDFCSRGARLEVSEDA